MHLWCSARAKLSLCLPRWNKKEFFFQFVLDDIYKGARDRKPRRVLLLLARPEVRQAGPRPGKRLKPWSDVAKRGGGRGGEVANGSHEKWEPHEWTKGQKCSFRSKSAPRRFNTPNSCQEELCKVVQVPASKGSWRRRLVRP